MIDRKLTQSELYREYSSLLDPMGYRLIEISRSVHGDTVQISCAIMLRDGTVTVDDCAKVYEVIYPRLQMQLGDRDLALEVSTPGLTRTFRDYEEFYFFTGKRVRLYDLSQSAWISGIIEKADDEGVTLRDASLEDKKDVIPSVFIKASDVQKAKLEYIWEDNQHAK